MYLQWIDLTSLIFYDHYMFNREDTFSDTFLHSGLRNYMVIIQYVVL